jgi:putative transposase
MLDMLNAISCEQLHCELIEFGGEDDKKNLHLCLEKHSRSKLNQSYGASPSYCVVSLGGASLDVIENQRKPPSEKQINQSRKISTKPLACLTRP